MDPFSGALVAGLSFFLILTTAVPFLLFLVALVYVALRVRDAKAEHPDPELGLKTAYWFLYTLGVLVAHFGATILLSHWLQLLELTGPAPQRMMVPGGFGRPAVAANDDWSAASRTGWGMTLAGLLLAGAFYLVGALGTRDKEWPTVRRVFTGGRIAVGGMIVVFAFTFLFVMQFQRELPPGLYESALAALAVWLPSLAVHVFLFRWGGTPAYHVPAEVPRRRGRSRYVEDEEPRAEPDRARQTPRDEESPPRPDDDEGEQPRRRRPRDDD
jgi:hypothetical protein